MFNSLKGVKNIYGKLFLCRWMLDFKIEKKYFLWGLMKIIEIFFC